MSLQRYLFLLIGTLIIVFSAIQYYFIEQVRVQVNDEITNKTRTLSQVALSAITERFPIAPDPKHVLSTDLSPIQYKIKIKNTPNKELKIDEDLIMVTGQQTKTITILRTEPKVSDKKVFVRSADGEMTNINKVASGKIKAMFVNRVNTAYTVDFDFEDEDQNFQKIVSFDSAASSVDQYFSQLRWQLFGFTLAGLLGAFWLAKHASKPLSQLSKGFADLGHGDLGVQIEQSGVKEMRETIAIFNQTSQRLAQLQELERNYQQQQQMAELGEVARGLAHTLRNPLNTIGLGISQMQQPNVSAQEQVLIAQQIQEKIVQLDTTIKTLMHLANADVDRSKLLNIVSVVSDIMLEVSVRSQARIEFPMAFSEQAILLKGAEAEIRAIIHALISNAIEANEGQDKGHPVSVELQQLDGGVCLQVRDYGKGLSDNDKAHIFKPHFTTKAEGAGMGLFIVKRISEMYYRGSIDLSHHEEGGCIAKLVLYDAIEAPNYTYSDTFGKNHS